MLQQGDEAEPAVTASSEHFCQSLGAQQRPQCHKLGHGTMPVAFYLGALWGGVDRARRSGRHLSAESCC